MQDGEGARAPASAGLRAVERRPRARRGGPPRDPSRRGGDRPGVPREGRLLETRPEALEKASITASRTLSRTMFAKRDVFALLMSCFAVYYSTLSEGVVGFHPAFVVARDGVPGETAWDRRDQGGVFASGDVDDPTDSGNARARDDRPPPPRFFDLNGDGVREMLVATWVRSRRWRRRCGWWRWRNGGRQGSFRRVAAMGGARGANRNRRNRKHSSSTLEILAAEPRAAEAPRSSDPPTRSSARACSRGSAFFLNVRRNPVESNRIESLRPKSGVALDGWDRRRRRRRRGRCFRESDPRRRHGVGRVLREARNASSLNERPVTRSNVQQRGRAQRGRRGGHRGWHGVCFDHNLRVMWERALGGDFPKHAKPRVPLFWSPPPRCSKATAGR